MEHTYLMPRLGIDNHTTWFFNIEYAAKMKGCWEAIQEQVEGDVEVALETPGGLPPKAVLTATLTSTQATAEQRVAAGLQLRALDWDKMDATALGLMHQNVTDMCYPAFRTHQTAHALWQHLQLTYRSQGLARTADIRQKMASLRMQPKEAIPVYISRGSALLNELRDLGQTANEVDLVAAVLAGLPRAYSGVVGTLTMLRVTSLAEVTEHLMAAEVTHKRDDANEMEEARALAVVGAGRHAPPHGSARAPYAGPIAPYAHASDRYNPVPFRPDGPRRPVASDAYRVCYGCNQMGHIRLFCPNTHGAPGGYNRPPAMAAAQTGMAPMPNTPHVVAKPLPPTVHRPPRGPGGGGLAMTATCATATVTGAQRHVDMTDWVIDNGASHHMVGSEDEVTECTEIDAMTIKTATGEEVVVSRGGTATMDMHTTDGLQAVILNDVLVVPDLSLSLFSIRAMMVRGFKALFSDGGVEILDGVTVVFRWCPRGNLLVLPLASKVEGVTGWAGTAVSAPVWHQRLAHAGADAVWRTRTAVDGMELTPNARRSDMLGLCEPCVLGKQTRMPFPTSATATTAPLQLFHTDVCGPMPVASTGGAFYFVSVIDDSSDTAAAIPIVRKSDAGPAVRRTVGHWEVVTGSKLRAWRSDRGGEYTSSVMADWTSQNGSRHQTTAPYTPQQNGKAERFNSSVMEKVLAVLAAADFDKKWWAEAVATVVHTMNRTVRAGRTTTPFELWCGRRPNIDHLRTFGCTAYVLTATEKCRKLDNRSRRARFLGYEPDCKAYRLLCDDKIVISRDVVFDETPCAAALDQTSLRRAPISLVRGAGTADDYSEEADAPATTDAAAELPAPPVVHSLEVALARAADLPSADRGSTPDGGPTHRYPSRERAAPQRLGGEGHATTAIGIGDELACPWLVAADDGAAASPRANNPVGAALVAHAGSSPDKMTLAQAKKAHDWPAFDAATRQEVDSLWKNGTLELADLPAGATVLPIKIICERKRGADRQLTRHQSRAVARGDRQLYGRDYTDVFAPVVRRATLLVVLALATARRLHMLQLDIETAFLNGHLDETIYVLQPKGYERGDPKKVCRLRKALHGLKQAARQWFIELVKLMDTMGMTQSLADACLFYKDVAGERVFLLVCVDDLLRVSSTAPQLEAMREAVSAAFQARNMGKPTFFLGLHVDRDEEAGTMVVSQRSFILTLLERHGMEDAKPAPLPLAVGVELRKAGEELAPTGVLEYQTMIGGLLYLSANTRPDIAYAVGRLARYASAPTTTHVTLTKGIMRYLRGTADWGLRFGAAAPLPEYCDADFAEDLDSR